jgi:hypothetical protein
MRWVKKSGFAVLGLLLLVGAIRALPAGADEGGPAILYLTDGVEAGPAKLGSEGLARGAGIEPGKGILVSTGGAAASLPVPILEIGGYDVLNLTPRDVNALKTVLILPELPFVSANVTLPGHRFPPSRTVSRGGKTITFVGLAAASAASPLPESSFAPPEAALEKLLPGIPEDAGRIIVLADAPLSVVAGWAARFPGVDTFIVSGRGGGVYDRPLGRIVRAPPGGREIGVLDGDRGRVIRLPEPATPLKTYLEAAAKSGLLEEADVGERIEKLPRPERPARLEPGETIALRASDENEAGRLTVLSARLTDRHGALSAGDDEQLLLLLVRLQNTRPAHVTGRRGCWEIGDLGKALSARTNGGRQLELVASAVPGVLGARPLRLDRPGSVVSGRVIFRVPGADALTSLSLELDDGDGESLTVTILEGAPAMPPADPPADEAVPEEEPVPPEEPSPPEEAAPAAEPAGPPMPSGPLSELEPNESASRAQLVPANARVQATVKGNGDRDNFLFEFERAAFIRAGVTARKGVDFELRLYGPDRKLLMRVDGQGPGEPEELLCRIRHGEHRLEVESRTEGALKEAPYTLTLKRLTLRDYEPPMAEVKAAIRKGLGYLGEQQGEDGAFPNAVSTPGVTGLALMAFLGEKDESYLRIEKAAAGYFKGSYVAPGAEKRSPRDEAGKAGLLIGDRARHIIYAQAIAVLAMAEYVERHGDEEAREMVAEGVKLLLRSQASGARPPELGGPFNEKHRWFGGWKYTPHDKMADLSASGWCLIALKAAREAGFSVPEQAEQDFMVFCRGCFDEKVGAYGYAPAGGGRPTNTTNAVGVLTTLLIKGGDCPVVRDGLSRIRRGFPNWEIEGGTGRYPFYYWYYASRAMYMAGGDYWKEWRAAICPMLLDHQNEDGSFNAVDDEEEVGMVYTTSLAVLILQLVSGNPPSYLKGLDLTAKSYPCPDLVKDIEKLVRRAETDRSTKEELTKEILELIDRFYGE